MRGLVDVVLRNGVVEAVVVDRTGALGASEFDDVGRTAAANAGLRNRHHLALRDFRPFECLPVYLGAREDPVGDQLLVAVGDRDGR